MIYLINHFLEKSAQKNPKKVAIICGEKRTSYANLNAKANALASYLKTIGVKRQDRVGIFLENSLEAVISIFGILKADAIFVVCNPTLKSKKLSYIIKDCQIEVIIADYNKSSTIREALADYKAIKSVIWVDMNDTSISEKYDEWLSMDFNQIVNEDLTEVVTMNNKNIDMDLATIVYTSGSTGDPKGVMLSHRSIISAIRSITSYLENNEDDIILDTLPLSFDYGLYQVLMAASFGGTVVLERSFAFPYRVVQRMIQERVTGFPGVPTIFAILLGLNGLERFDFSSLRYITNTAAALPLHHVQFLRRVFPHVRIYSMYGLTECKRVSYLPPEDLERKPGSVGKAMPNEEVWLEDETGNRLGPGQIGELIVRGSNVMSGYWGLPEESNRVLKSGIYPGESVLKTGDLFRMDEEGYLYFVGRKDDMIKSRGERISPREIEDCINSVEGVAECAVVGVPDEILGQAIVAFVRCLDGARITGDRVLKQCKKNLEDFMVPKEVYFVSTFPKTSTGKIDKRALAVQARGAGWQNNLE